MPEQAIEKIFDPFFRVDAARQTDTGGIGLGLSIAQRAISLHRGRIWAENVHPGLRVVIELPASLHSSGVKPSERSRGHAPVVSHVMPHLPRCQS